MGGEKNNEIVKKTATEVQLAEHGQQPSVETMMMKAIEQGMTAETMEKFLSMRRELKAEHAKSEFDRAMAEFQAECPVIEKDKKAKDKNGKTMYSYAPLDSIVEQVGALIGKHGFSYTFKTDNKPERITVTCIVKHRDGHSEESTMETSLANKTDIMSGPQVIAATVTFNKRYSFCNAFGIMTGDEDTDAQGVGNGPKLATDAQKAEIDALATGAGLTKQELSTRFRDKYKVSITEMTDVQAQGVILSLKSMQKK